MTSTMQRAIVLAVLLLVPPPADGFLAGVLPEFWRQQDPEVQKTVDGPPAHGRCVHLGAPRQARWWPAFGGTRQGIGQLAAAGQAVDIESVLKSNAGVLSDEEQQLAALLLELGQEHVFDGWPEAGTQDEDKHRFFRQVHTLDKGYPGGLKAYVQKARKLLKESQEGLNPFEGFTPSVPEGELLDFGTPEYEQMERVGAEAVSRTAFVLVAGGLGERLGYNGIKLALPVEATTRQCYLELYCKHILALQEKSRASTGDRSLTLPLIIMTSKDTDAKTRNLLQEQKNFGMAADQIIVVMQDKVPALADSSARLALDDDDPFQLQSKPHGHGDVHQLLHREGVARKLLEQGFQWLFFFQDTNALVLNSILPALGASVTNDYAMNSICVPRKAKEAAGGIAALTREDGTSIVINVEYNQLDPLLRATISPEGDVNDPETGHSPFPGNCNQIVFKLEPYVKVLEGEDQGVVVEFVNPKYKDDTRTTFKKPTRLECMMQDFPKLITKELGHDAKIGFTTLEKWLSFSPAKNSLEAGADLAKGGVPAGTASSAESDYYAQAVRRLEKAVGCQFDAPADATYAGVPFYQGPRVVLSPSFATDTDDLRKKVTKDVKLAAGSTLVVDGEGIKLEALDLEGALVVKAAPGARVCIKGLKVRNKGWGLTEIPAGEEVLEEDRVRGYLVERVETKSIDITEPGDYLVGINGDVSKVHFNVLEDRT